MFRDDPTALALADAPVHHRTYLLRQARADRHRRPQYGRRVDRHGRPSATIPQYVARRDELWEGRHGQPVGAGPPPRTHDGRRPSPPPARLVAPTHSWRLLRAAHPGGSSARWRPRRPRRRQRRVGCGVSTSRIGSPKPQPSTPNPPPPPLLPPPSAAGPSHGPIPHPPRRGRARQPPRAVPADDGGPPTARLAAGYRHHRARPLARRLPPLPRPPLLSLLRLPLPPLRPPLLMSLVRLPPPRVLRASLRSPPEPVSRVSLPLPLPSLPLPLLAAPSLPSLPLPLRSLVRLPPPLVSRASLPRRLLSLRSLPLLPLLPLLSLPLLAAPSLPSPLLSLRSLRVAVARRAALFGGHPDGRRCAPPPANRRLQRLVGQVELVSLLHHAFELGAERCHKPLVPNQLGCYLGNDPVPDVHMLRQRHAHGTIGERRQ